MRRHGTITWLLARFLTALGKKPTNSPPLAADVELHPAGIEPEELVEQLVEVLKLRGVLRDRSRRQSTD